MCRLDYSTLYVPSIQYPGSVVSPSFRLLAFRFRRSGILSRHVVQIYRIRTLFSLCLILNCALFAISLREVVGYEEIRSLFFRGSVGGGGSAWKHKTVSFEQPTKSILLSILLGISFYGRGFFFLYRGGFDGQYSNLWVAQGKR
jgi:hypothetical protein